MKDPLVALMERDPDLSERLMTDDPGAWREAYRALVEDNKRLFRERPLPLSKTDAPAGTQMKIKVATRRDDDGYRPCHPDDAPPEAEGIERVGADSTNNHQSSGIRVKKGVKCKV